MNRPAIETIDLPAAALGTRRSLTVVRYGVPGRGPKAYLQAGLHAGEAPGLMVMHHLRALLDRHLAEGNISGEVVLVPCANPVGLSQWQQEALEGRFDVATGINFNREHLDLTEAVADRVATELDGDERRNVDRIRQAEREVLADMAPQDETAFLKHCLLTLACDADIVLDLHCDLESILHLYLGTSLWPMAADLPTLLGAQLTLLADDSGVTPFDEACSRIWWRLADRFPDRPLSPACLAATVELRGRVDVSHDLAARDAANILAFLAHRGVLAGGSRELPPSSGEALPLTGVENVTAPVPGIVTFLKKPGERVNPGEAVAHIVDPAAADPGEGVTVLSAVSGGLLYGRICDRYARPGRILARIAGAKPLRQEGENLLPA
jgi:predicted deacylase